MAVIDHLVLFTPDLDAGIEHAEREFGVRPVVGGQHHGRGTHNALLGLGDSYLEIISPDPRQPEPSTPRPFGIDGLETPAYVAFAVRPTETETLEDLVAAMASVGLDPGEPTSMSRSTPAGDELRWRLTFPIERYGGAMPFLIDWGETPKPHSTAPAGPRLRALRVTSPDATDVAAAVDALGLGEQIVVGAGPTAFEPEFSERINSPHRFS